MIDLKENLVGKSLGGYRITRVIGKGGMSVVYEAERAGRPPKAAIKIPSPNLLEDQEYLRAFFNEGQLQGRVKHPNVVEIYEMSQQPPFIAMELVNGQDLAMMIRKAKMMPARIATKVAIQVASALGAIHREGIVHRDMKPKNILMDNIGGAKLMDFGIAGMRPSEEDGTSAASEWLGTLAYLAPEAAKSQPVDHRSDIYQLGVIMFEMLTGKPPFIADTIPEVLRRIKETPAPPTEAFNETVTEELDEVVQKCMAKDPAARFVNALSLERELKKVLAELP